MTNTSNLGSRFAAAISALAISLVMISTTVTVPSAAQAQNVLNGAAYVSTVA